MIQLHRISPEASLDNVPAEDVVKLRAQLEAAGYTASDDDIVWAWNRVSRVFFTRWYGMDNHATWNVAHLLKYLRPE